MMKPAIPILFLLVATISAQDPTPVTGVDVHVITVEVPREIELPELRAESVRRYTLDPDAAGTSRGPDATWSVSPGIRQLNIHRDRQDRLVMDYRFRARRRSWSSSGGTLDISGDVMEFRHNGYYGGRNRTYRCLLFIPWELDEDGEKPELEPWAPEAYANWLVEHLLDHGHVGRTAATAMLHIPLARLVDAPLLARFRNWLAELAPDGTHPERGNRNRSTRSRMSARNLILGLRLVASDPDAIEELDSRELDWVLYSSLHLAFIQIGDPVLKGKAGWTLMYPNQRSTSEHDRHNSQRQLVVPYFELAEAGKVVIPGTPEEQKRRHALFAAWVAEADPTPALVVIGLAGLALFGVAFAARRVALKLAM